MMISIPIVFGLLALASLAACVVVILRKLFLVVRAERLLVARGKPAFVAEIRGRELTPEENESLRLKMMEYIDHLEMGNAYREELLEGLRQRQVEGRARYTERLFNELAEQPEPAAVAV